MDHTQYSTTSDHHEGHNGSISQQIVNGTHNALQNTKADFRGLADSAPPADTTQVHDGEEPLTHYHNFFIDLFTWKYPRATGFAFVSIVSTVMAFHYVNVLRYIFKAAYIVFATVTAVEIAGRPFGSKGVVSSIRPRRYYTIPRESLDRVFAGAHDLLNFFVLEVQRLVFADNIFATALAFLVTFFSYFLIKYMPFWSLLLLATTTAFTVPLIYIQNQQVIDEQFRRASEWANVQFHHTRQLTEKYAGDAAIRARATAVDLTHKVQDYTAAARNKTAAVSNKAASVVSSNAPSTAHTNAHSNAHLNTTPSAPDAPSTVAHNNPTNFANEEYAAHNNFPNAPTHEPHVPAHHHAQEPLFA